MLLIGAICVAAAVVLYILQPILTGEEASLHREDDELTEAEARKRIALLALRDVEYDHATGKLDEDDYQSLRDELTVEALEALQSIAGDAAAKAAAGVDGSADDPLEREIAEFRAMLHQSRAGGEAGCPSCARRNSPSSRFCAHCGAALPPPGDDGPRAGPPDGGAEAERAGSHGE